MNTKTKGNKAESVILAEFIKNNIPVSLPFGDNEKYDLVIEINGVFKSVQVKYGQFKNECVVSDLRYRIGKNRVAYSTYTDKVDLIAIWCEALNECYLIPVALFQDRKFCHLRVNPPKNNSCVSTVVWAKDYRFAEILGFLK